MKYPEDGRYEVGDDMSSVAVCTLATVEMKLPMDKIAIKGKCVTENVGIEKIIKNILANPNIKYLLCCGKESRGHFITNAFICLKENGVDENGNIIKALGAMPSVKNLTEEEIKQFRDKIEIIDYSNIHDVNKIMEIIYELQS